MGVDFADRAVVRAIARLARFELTDDEIDRLGPELASILRYVEQLGAVPTDGVEPTAFAGEGGDFRAPGQRLELPAGAHTANAPDHFEGAFRVPKVL